MPLTIDRLDHFVLTVADIDATCDFYTRVLGMRRVRFGGGRWALAFGRQKINLHPAGNEYEPKATVPAVGAGDFCLIAEGAMDDIMAHLAAEGVETFEGPGPRTGALGVLNSIYFRDPDGNLVEVSVYEDAAVA